MYGIPIFLHKNINEILHTFIHKKKSLQNKPDFMISTLLVKLVACIMYVYSVVKESKRLQHGKYNDEIALASVHK